MRVLALVPDLMDRSKVKARFPDARFVASAAALVTIAQEVLAGEAGTSAPDLVIVDLGRPGVLDGVRILLAAPIAAGGVGEPGPRVVGFASHVDDETLAAARAVGVEALPRSVFFRRLPEMGEPTDQPLVDQPARSDQPATETAPLDVAALLARTTELATTHLSALAERPVGVTSSPDGLRAALGGPLPDEPTDPTAVVEQLAEGAAAGLVASNGPRYFGFVTGGSLPAALAADWLTSTWDQNVALGVMSPAAAVVEETVGEWLADLLGLPPTVSFGLVTGAQMANTVGLAAARHHVLARHGVDLGRVGLAGAPPLRVVVGAERHVTIDVALRYLGIGTDQITVVPTDDQGRMRPDALVEALDRLGDGPTIVCAQAGCVNSGAFDPIDAIVTAAHGGTGDTAAHGGTGDTAAHGGTGDTAAHGGTGRWAWVHVDGAFGLWAGASPGRRHLVAGVAGADSWATDGHKWLNVPYDSGLAFVAHPDDHRAAMAMQSAAYLVRGADALRDGSDWAPEASRRARAFPLWAALRSLGRRGVADLVERNCRLAARAATALAALPGVEILNDVVLNQVLVRFVDGATATPDTRAGADPQRDGDARTAGVIAAVQASGVAWLGGTTWAGAAAARISVSGWSTSDDDIDRLVAAVSRAVAG